MFLTHTMVLCGHTMLSALAIIVIYRQCLVRLVNLVSLSSIIDIRLLGWVVWIVFCKIYILKLLVGIELILLTALIVHRLLVLVLLIHVAQWVVHSLQVVVVLLGIEHIILRKWLRLNGFFRFLYQMLFEVANSFVHLFLIIWCNNQIATGRKFVRRFTF